MEEAGLLHVRGLRGPFSDLQGQEREEGRGVGKRVRFALGKELPQGSLGLRGRGSRCLELPQLSGKPPREDPFDEHAGVLVRGSEEEDEGAGCLPERDECGDIGHGDSFEEQRGVGAETLPYDRRPRSGETEPTTFETLTCEALGLGSGDVTRYGRQASG